MAEKNIFIDAGGIKVEGLLEDVPGNRAVLVTHPHPLYGGSMHNNVVESLIHAYGEKGYTTLRINFRGVGQSQGNHENGVGEQQDVAAGLKYLAALGKDTIDLAGYSFGAWVCALGLENYSSAQRLIMVSPPVSFIDFSFLKYNPKIQLVIAGTVDEIAGANSVEQMLETWNPEAVFQKIDGADHFYGGKEGELHAIVSRFLSHE
ncbi:alpha/beta hydrolase [Thermodesulfobacteriota bacterium]